MKKLVTLFLISAGLSAHLLTAQEADDANATWQRILVLNRPTAPSADGSKDAEIERLTSLEQTADSFWQRYADDPNVWVAKFIVLQARVDHDELRGQKPDLHIVSADVRDITCAKNA